MIQEQAPPEDVQLKMLTATAVYKPGGGPSAASTQIIAAGEELTLECSSDGFPSPMIQFMLNGNQIDFEDWITIKDDTRTSEGKYLKRTIKVDDIGLQENSLVWSCQANNLKGYDTSDEIYTQYRYKPTILTGSLQVVKRVRMNSAVDITCEVKPGNPSHTEVSWVQGKDGYGNTVANGNRLLWSGAVVEPAKTGFYTCVASNAIGRSTFTIHIIIEYPPVVQISPTVTSVEEGTELVLVCDIDAEPKEVQIEWGHQSIELQDTHRNVLSIPNVTRSHGGRYTCTVKNEHGSASKSAQVTILYRPNLNFRLQPNKRAFLEGEAVTIICFAQANPQVTELSVYRRDADIPAAVLDDTNRSPNRKSYTISKLNRTHSGLYRCSAKNTVGRSTEEIDLTVQHVPIIKKLNPQVIDEGQALRVRCDVESEPPAKISWFSPDRRLIKTGQHLVMEKMSQSDAGSYLCKAQNTFYNDIPQIASMEVKVFVRFPPQYLPCSPKNLEGIFSSLPGESAKLCCQFILYPTNQPERVQWFRNTRENSDEITQLKVRTTKVTDDSSEYQVKLRSELTISNVVENNFTDYFCAVKNDKGEQFKKIRLNQLRTPPAPTIQDVKAESNALRVSWSPVSYMTSSDSWYEVGYKPVGKKDYQTKKAGNNNELVITSLKSKQKYDVSVKACNSVGCSEFPPPKQGVADRASGSGGGGSSPGGDSSVAGSNNVPLRTMVIVPLVVFGLVLLISLLIVICRRNRDQRRNAALKKDKNTSRDNYGHIPVPTNSVNGRCGLGVGAIPGVPVVMGVGSVSKSPQLAKAPHQGVHIWGNTSTLPPTSLSSGFSPRLGSAHPHSSALQYNSHVVPTLRLAHNSTNGSLPKGIAAHPEELEVLKQNQVNSLPPPPGPPILNNNGINNSNNLNINTLSSIISNTSNDLDQNNPKLDGTYVDYSLGPPGSTSYQMLSPKHPNITSATQQPSLVSMGTMSGGTLGGPDRPPISSHQLHPQQPGMPPPASVINMSGSLDKASFNRLRGEPEGKERVRFADADGNTLYPGDVEPHAPPVHHHTLTNGKLPHQNGGPNYNPGSHRYSTLPNKLSPPGSNVIPVASTSHSPPIVVNLHPGGLPPSGQQIPVSSIPTSESAQEHIYSTTSRVKPAPLPRAPSTNLSQSQLSNSSTSSVGSKSPPPPTLPPAAANGPILKKGPTNAARNLSEAINPPVSIEGDHKTLTLKCPSGYSITSV